MMKEKVKKYYEAGVWSEERVRNAVLRGWISESDYAEIVGEKG